MADEVPEQPTITPVERELSKIYHNTYVIRPNGFPEMDCTPTKEQVLLELEAQLRDGRFEEREFSNGPNQAALEAEAKAACWNSAEDIIPCVCDFVRRYHARRVAYFMHYGWTNPPRVHADGRIIDGGHRLMAAAFMGKSTVQVVVVHPPPHVPKDAPAQPPPD